MWYLLSLRRPTTAKRRTEFIRPTGLPDLLEMSQPWWCHIAQKTLGEGSSHGEHQHKKPFKHMNNALVLNCTELCPKALQQAAKPSPCAATELRARATCAALGEGNLLAPVCGNEWEVLIVSCNLALLSSASGFWIYCRH